VPECDSLTPPPHNRQDAHIAGQATGAMSWAFIAALKKNPQQSYVALLNSIRDELESKYTQKPQLSCSHPLSKQYPRTGNGGGGGEGIDAFHDDSVGIAADDFG